MPLSPIETPSALDLSYSPSGSVLGDNVCLPSQTTTISVPCASSLDNKRRSAVIDLFGMPVEKPAKIQKVVQPEEPKHQYCVNSHRVCRKMSCSVTSEDMVPTGAHLPGEPGTHRRQTSSWDTFRSSELANREKQRSRVHAKCLPNSGCSDTDTCYSEPLFSCSASRQSGDKWWSMMSDTDISSSYLPAGSTLSSSADLSDPDVTADHPCSSFQVNVVNSPQSVIPIDMKTAHVPVYPSVPSLSRYPEHWPHPSPTRSVCQNLLHPDTFMSDHEKVHGESLDAAENVAGNSSSPFSVRPDCCPSDSTGCFLLDYGRQSASPCRNVHSDHLPTGHKQHCQLLHILSPQHLQQQQQVAGLHRLPPRFTAAHADSCLYLGSHGDAGKNTCRGQCWSYKSKHNPLSGKCFRNGQWSPRQESYLVSAGLDCATDEALVSRSTENNCSEVSALGWHGALHNQLHQSGSARPQASVASSGRNNDDKTSMSRLPTDISLVNNREHTSMARVPPDVSLVREQTSMSRLPPDVSLVREQTSMSRLPPNVNVLNKEPTMSDSSSGSYILPTAIIDKCGDVSQRYNHPMKDNNLEILSHTTPMAAGGRHFGVLTNMELLPACWLRRSVGFPHDQSHQAHGIYLSHSSTHDFDTMWSADGRDRIQPQPLTPAEPWEQKQQMSILEKQQAELADMTTSPWPHQQGPSFDQVTHRPRCQESTDNQGSRDTPGLVRDWVPATPAPTPSSSSSSMLIGSSSFQTLHDTQGSRSQEPVARVASQDTSKHARTGRDSQEMGPDPCTYNTDNIIIYQLPLASGVQVAVHSPDTCLHSATDISNRQGSSSDSQTGHKLVQDAACSPITELSLDHVPAETDHRHSRCQTPQSEIKQGNKQTA